MADTNGTLPHKSEVDFFSLMFEPTGNKIVLTGVFCAIEFLGSLSIAAILSYDRSRPNLKRTLLNSLSSTFFVAQLVVVNVLTCIPPMIRVWSGPIPLASARTYQQLVLACSYHNVLLILEYTVVKYVLACRLKSAGTHLDGILATFLPTMNVLLATTAMIVFVYMEVWPMHLRIAMLSGADPASVLATAGARPHRRFDPEIAMNALGAATTALILFTSAAVYREKSKISADGGKESSALRNPRTGLPRIPRAPPVISLTKMTVALLLVCLFVMTPALMAKYNVTDPEVLRASRWWSLLYACISMFGFSVIATLVLPALIFVSDGKFRQFLKRRILAR